MKFIATTSDKMKDIEVVSGQLIFSRDDRVIYLDTDVRTSFQQIIALMDEAQRVNMVAPINNAYYFVEESCILYYYTNKTWKAITTPPDEKTVFLGEEKLPTTGKASTLYITKTGIYQWDEETNDYICMGGEDLLAWRPMSL